LSFGCNSQRPPGAAEHPDTPVVGGRGKGFGVDAGFWEANMEGPTETKRPTKTGQVVGANRRPHPKQDVYLTVTFSLRRNVNSGKGRQCAMPFSIQRGVNKKGPHSII